MATSSSADAAAGSPAGGFRTAGFHFFADFDSGNLGRVERVEHRAVADSNEEEEDGAAPAAVAEHLAALKGGGGGEEAAAATGEDPSPAADQVAAAPTPKKGKKRSRRRKAKPESLSAPPAASEPTPTPSTPSDAEFDLWTRPDCQGTPFENGNRTWFYFGIRRDPAGYASPPLSSKNSHLLKLNVRNLNKQSKLFSQGMAPIVMVVPYGSNGGGGKSSGLPIQPPWACHQRWERLRERPTFGTTDGSFDLSFRVRVEPRAVTYVAFTYPYSYRELQNYLGRLERKYGGAKCADYAAVEHRPPGSIYFHRELVCRSCQGRRIDLLTVSSVSGATPEREDRLENLFPPEAPDQPEGGCSRPLRFTGKKVVFVSARVHPGETQSSFVFNGFLKFLLRENDPRSIALRKKYVFKLIPMLNPDGVVSGHYRTDCRGVNLNRVYGNPSFDLHPSIYAARKLLLYAHRGYEVSEDMSDAGAGFEEAAAGASSLDEDEAEEQEEEGVKKKSGLRIVPGSGSAPTSGSSCATTPVVLEPPSAASTTSSSSSAAATRWLRSSLLPPGESPAKDPAAATPPTPAASSSSSSLLPSWYEMTETSRCSEGDESIADFSVTPVHGEARARKASETGPTSFRGAFSSLAAAGASSSPRRKLNFDGLQVSSTLAATLLPPPPSMDSLEAENSNFDFAQKLDSCANLERSEKGSGRVFLYVDVHGHASKRGIFMYGNHFADMDKKVDSMLLPKLMSINCANFDFPACNFTERNMYLKDRHTGAGREGSGRVSCFKAIGLVYSYTLECNFNTGRVVNDVPMASRDSGRATPPPLYDHPPKYDPAVYEESGKAMAISALDLTESNPWTRLTCSSCKNLKGVRESIRKYIKQNEEAAKQKAAAAADLGHHPGSPTRRGRRNRTTSHNSTGAARAKKASSAVIGSSVSGGKTPVSSPANKSSSPLKSPASPESYRPVTKIPRKNAQGIKQSSSSVSSSSSFPAASAAPGLPLARDARAKKGSAALLHRSRSIPGAAVPPAVLLPYAQDAAAAVLATGASPAGRREPSGQGVKLTRSKSNPGSRPGSPKRMKGGSGKARKKKAPAAAGKSESSSNSRKNSSCSVSSAETASASSPTRKKKAAAAAGSLKKKRKGVVAIPK